MGRLKKTATTALASQKPEKGRPSNAERSAYFARREAAKVLRTIIQGDAKRRAAGSIKSLVYSPSIRNKRGTFALVCQTLKYLPILKDVLDSASILNSKWKRQGELMYIIAYDILFGQAASLFGDAEKFLLLRKDALQLALAQLLVRKGVKNIKDLISHQQLSDISKPRYIRVNTLKLDSESALQELGKQYMVRAILLDPSCSGSGTVAVRLDHLLPSHGVGNADANDVDRLRKLQAFQKKALAHALSFPTVERIVYSTCSIHQIENEDVIKSILPLASSFGFQLATPFPHWPRRGLPVVQGSEHLLRTDPVEDKEGFFIALFVRKLTNNHAEEKLLKPCGSTSEALHPKKSSCGKEKPRIQYKISMYNPFFKMSKMMLQHKSSTPRGLPQFTS